MLHIREVSDLHLEFYYDLYDQTAALAKQELTLLIPHLPTDKKTVLIVSGDLATARRAGRIVTFMNIVTPRFKHVIFVLGNHEHYGSKMSETRQTIVEALAQSLPDNLFKKVSVVGNDPAEIKIGDVRFLCATLWTDYGPPEVHAMISRYIRDHSTITNDDGSYVTPTQLSLVHQATLSKFGEWMEGQDNSKTVVCTHHMPSFQAVDPIYMTDPTTRMLNHAFTSNLDDFIMKHQPAIWTFGHTHTRYFGKIGNTQLVCNPLGYPQERNQARGVYDPENLMSL